MSFLKPSLQNRYNISVEIFIYWLFFFFGETSGWLEQPFPPNLKVSWMYHEESVVSDLPIDDLISLRLLHTVTVLPQCRLKQVEQRPTECKHTERRPCAVVPCGLQL